MTLLQSNSIGIKDIFECFMMVLDYWSTEYYSHEARRGFFLHEVYYFYFRMRKIFEYLNCNYLRSGWATISDGLTTICFGYW